MSSYKQKQKGTVCLIAPSYPKTPSRDASHIFNNGSQAPRTLQWSRFSVPELHLQHASVLGQASRSTQEPPSHKVQPHSKGQNRTDTPASVLNREIIANFQLNWPDEKHNKFMFAYLKI